MAHHVLVLAGQRVNSTMRSISSPKNSTRIANLVVVGQVDVHRVPFTRNLLRMKFMSLRFILQLDQTAASRSIICIPGRLMTMLR